MGKLLDPACVELTWVQGGHPTSSGTVGNLPAECSRLQKQPLQGQRHCHHGRRAHLLCACLDQYPDVAQDRYVPKPEGTASSRNQHEALRHYIQPSQCSIIAGGF